MRIERFKSAKDFLAINTDYLIQAEATNGLILGLSIANLDAPEDDTLYLTISDSTGIQFSAIKTSGRNLLIYGNTERSSEYTELLINFLVENKVTIPGLIGPSVLVDTLAEAIKNRTNRKYHIAFRQLIYTLTKVSKLPPIKGTIRLATMADIECIEKWFHLFTIEAMNEDNKSSAYKAARDKIEAEEVFLWVDNEVVAMTCVARPTVKGITINYVYTPPKHRKHGYGTQLVSAVSALMLDGKYEYCTLFTDMANPTSNSIYQKIGYQEVCEFRVVEFV